MMRIYILQRSNERASIVLVQQLSSATIDYLGCPHIVPIVQLLNLQQLANLIEELFAINGVLPKGRVDGFELAQFPRVMGIERSEEGNEIAVVVLLEKQFGCRGRDRYKG